MLQTIVSKSVKTGAILSMTTTAAIFAAGWYDTGDPWSALNCVPHMIDGDAKDPPVGFTPRESGLGIALNALAMGAWAILYEGALTTASRRSTAATAVTAAASAYIVDYFVVPKRFTPGFEKRLNLPSMLAIYGVLAFTLAVSEVWNGADTRKSS